MAIAFASTATAVQAHLAELPGTPIALLTLGDAVHRVAVTPRCRRAGSTRLSVEDWRYEVEALDERTRAIRELSAAAAGPTDRRRSSRRCRASSFA